MLGFLKGIEKGVAREGAAQRDFYNQTLSSKENHLNRLLDQIKYNQQMKRLRDRDKRQDFVTDRAYDRNVLESDRLHQFREARAKVGDAQWDKTHQLRVNADTRAGETHTTEMAFREKYDPLRIQQIQGSIDATEAERQYLYGDPDDPTDGYRDMQKRYFGQQVADYEANAGVRDLERQLKVKQGEYNLGQGWQEYLEDKSLSQDLIRAQIGAYNERRTATPSRSGPTWLQTRDITVESLAPVVLDHLKSEGESAVWPWDKQAQFWPPGFQADRPFVSEDPNAVTQTSLLREAGGHLIEELLARGVDPNLAMQMVPQYWDEILDGKGSDVLKRLNRASKAAGYNDLELRKIYRDIVYEGAMNYMRFKQPNRPAGADLPDADKLLDTPIGQ